MGHRWFMYESTQVIYESYINLYRALMNPLWIPSSPHKKNWTLVDLLRYPTNAQEISMSTNGHASVIYDSCMNLIRSSMNHIWFYTKHWWIIYEFSADPKKKPKTLIDFLRYPTSAQGVYVDHTWAWIGHRWFICASPQIMYESYMNFYKTFVNHNAHTIDI
jgi:hypothetical protein